MHASHHQCDPEWGAPQKREPHQGSQETLIAPRPH